MPSGEGGLAAQSQACFALPRRRAGKGTRRQGQSPGPARPRPARRPRPCPVCLEGQAVVASEAETGPEGTEKAGRALWGPRGQVLTMSCCCSRPPPRDPQNLNVPGAARAAFRSRAPASSSVEPDNSTAHRRPGTAAGTPGLPAPCPLLLLMPSLLQPPGPQGTTP